jgi:hypothetical protein
VGVPYAVIKGAKRIDNEVDLAEELAPSTTRRRLRKRFYREKKDTQPPELERQSADSWTTADSDHGHGENGENDNPHRRSIGRDVRRGTKKSIQKILFSAARAPLDVSLAIAQGFHNAPRLYGDEVRHPARITGFHSGIRAAGKELALGIYDGFTGIVVQPYKGAKKEGVKGALKGVGKGLGGVFFKTTAGVVGVVGYSLKGIHRETVKGREKKLNEYIMRGRIRQGVKELEEEYRKNEGNDQVLEERMQQGWIRLDEERKKAVNKKERSLLNSIKEKKMDKKNRRRSEAEGGATTIAGNDVYKALPTNGAFATQIDSGVVTAPGSS